MGACLVYVTFNNDLTALKAKYDYMKERLDRHEAKLDRVIERTR